MIVSGQKTPERLKTVRVVSDETPKGYLIINADEFDAAVHERHASDPGEGGEFGDEPVKHAAPSRAVDDDELGGAEFPHQKRLKTVRVVSDETATGYMIINAADFDAAAHELHETDTKSNREETDVDVGDLAALSFPALRAAAKKLGVKGSGTRSEIETAILEKLTAVDGPLE